jgi:hypothetical protein
MSLCEASIGFYEAVTSEKVDDGSSARGCFSKLMRRRHAPRQVVSLLDEGLFFVEDSEIGKRLVEFSEKRYPFPSEEGLDFLSQWNVYSDHSAISFLHRC